MKIKAIINEWNGGRFGRGGKYIAIVEAETFKNGNIKKSGFKLIEYVKTIEKGYRANGNAAHSESIGEILEILED